MLGELYCLGPRFRPCANLFSGGVSTSRFTSLRVVEYIVRFSIESVESLLLHKRDSTPPKRSCISVERLKNMYFSTVIVSPGPFITREERITLLLRRQNGF